MADRRLKIILEAQDKVSAKLQKVEESVDKLSKSAERSQVGFSNLTKTFAGLTVGLSAFSVGVAAFDRFITAAEKASNLSTAFATLTERIGGTAETAIPKLREATDGLISDLELMRQANNAIILGLPVTEDSMADLANQASILGRAVGLDATSALESMITGLGRQSKLMLDNLGIVIDQEKAYKDYAEGLGKATEQLTDSERKLAFYEAVLRTARRATIGLDVETNRLSDSWGRFKTEIANTTAELQKNVNEGLGPWALRLAEISRRIRKGNFNFEDLFGPSAEGLTDPITRAIRDSPDIAKEIQESLRQNLTRSAPFEVTIPEIEILLPDDVQAPPFEQALIDAGLGTNEDLARRVRAVSDAWNLFQTQVASLPVERVSALTDDFITLGEDLLAEGGTLPAGLRALVIAAEQTTARMQELHDVTQDIFAGAVAGSVVDFGNAIGDAAVYGKEAFDGFFRAVLANFARAIAQALILQAILAALPGLGGGVGFLGRVGKILGFQHGGIVPGMGGAVPAIVHGGEMVLPAELAQFIMQQFRAPAPGVASIELKADIPLLVERVNEGVERGSLRVVASEFGGGRAVR